MTRAVTAGFMTAVRNGDAPPLQMLRHGPSARGMDLLPLLDRLMIDGHDRTARYRALAHVVSGGEREAAELLRRLGRPARRPIQSVTNRPDAAHAVLRLLETLRPSFPEGGPLAEVPRAEAVLIGARSIGSPREHFTGKIERPLAASGFAERREDALSLPASLGAIRARWDFSRGIVADGIADVGPEGRDGVLVNAPTRGHARSEPRDDRKPGRSRQVVPALSEACAPVGRPRATETEEAEPRRFRKVWTSATEALPDRCGCGRCSLARLGRWCAAARSRRRVRRLAGQWEPRERPSLGANTPGLVASRQVRSRRGRSPCIRRW